MKIGLFFGSFNPIHIGHLLVGEYMVDKTDLDRVWYVVSPHNPLKNAFDLAPEKDRLTMVRSALVNNRKLIASDLEFSLPKPSYTINTMRHLEREYPENKFVIIMGSDNIGHFHKWKDHKTLLDAYNIYIYRRPYYNIGPYRKMKNIKVFDAPMISISSTYIRELIRSGNSVRYLVPQTAEEYLKVKNLYKAV